jgi:hypothetical protein
VPTPAQAFQVTWEEFSKAARRNTEKGVFEYLNEILRERSPEPAQAVDDACDSNGNTWMDYRERLKATERERDEAREQLAAETAGRWDAIKDMEDARKAGRAEAQRELETANKERSDAVRYLATAQERIRELEAELCGWQSETGCETYAAAGDCVRSQEQRVAELETKAEALRSAHDNAQRNVEAQLQDRRHFADRAELAQREALDYQGRWQRAEAQLALLRKACAWSAFGATPTCLHFRETLPRSVFQYMERIQATLNEIGRIRAEQPAEVAKPEAPASQRELAMLREAVEAIGWTVAGHLENLGQGVDAETVEHALERLK